MANLPIIEGGRAGDGFLARTVAPIPSTTTTSAGFFRGTRSLHPLPDGTTSAELLERLQDSVRAMLKEARDEWTFVSVLGVANSPDAESVQPTVIIVAKPDTTNVERAEAIVGEAVDIQQRLEIDPLLSVEVVEGDVVNYAKSIDMIECIEDDFFPDRPYLGASIGTTPSGPAGTLGFYVKLEIPNRPDEYLAVTCHHVCSESADPLKAPGVVIQSPAPRVRDAKIDEMQGLANYARLDAPTSMAALLAQANLPNLPDARHPAIDRARTYQCSFGNILLTSGISRKSNDNHALDFALISLDPTRFPSGPNVLNNDPCASGLKFLAYHVHNNRKALSEKKVFKTGAATMTTFGKLSPSIADVRVALPLADGTFVCFESRELIVLDDARYGTPFARKGDSGAAIRDGKGAMIGMLWGGIVSGQHRRNPEPFVLDTPDRWPLKLSSITMVTPMKVLLREMEAEIERSAPGTSAKIHPLDMPSGPSIWPADSGTPRRCR